MCTREYDPREREASARDFTAWRRQMRLVRSAATHQARRMRRRPLLYAGAALTAVALALAGCGASSSSPSTSSSATGHSGGTFTILANSSFGVADPAQNYTLEEWQLLIDTHDGLTAFAHVGGVAGHQDRAGPGHLHPGCPPTAERPTSSTSAAGSSSPTARCSSPATSSPPSSASSRCPAPTCVLLRHRRRERVLDQGLQSQQGRRRQRLGLHADDQPDRAGPGADGPAVAAVRLRGPGGHLACS